MWQRLHSTQSANVESENNSLPSSSSPATPSPSAEFGAAERAMLLRIAHEAIAAGAEGRSYAPGRAEGVLAQPRGVFTTLYRRGQLRGCVGYVFAVHPLLNAVAETAYAAAFEDTRFAPVEREEVAVLAISLSVLSPTFIIEPSQIQIGRHGLMIRQDGHRGLLLPQVAAEHGWDVETFLEQTCFKAGLPGDAWKLGAQIEAFTAEIFADEGVHE